MILKKKQYGDIECLDVLLNRQKKMFNTRYSEKVEEPISINEIIKQEIYNQCGVSKIILIKD